MTGETRPGPATLEGLKWLAATGAVSVEAWAVAMGWGRTAAYRHAARLINADWARRQPTVRGGGALLYATRDGVAISGVRAAALAAAPAPTTWAHCDACGWVAAWLASRGRLTVGPRELLAGDEWHGSLRWTEHGSARSRGHRPDLVARVRADSPPMPIEVELATKSVARLRAVLGLYVQWIAAGRARALIYICGTEHLAERVTAEAAALGLTAQAGNLRIELLDTIRGEAADQSRAKQAGREAAA